MPNLGFFELTLFGIIALIVLGPEKLPVAARTLGRWYGKIRRMSTRLQHELVSELELTEVQNELKAEIAKIRESEAKIKAQMDALQQSLDHTHARAKQSTADILNDYQRVASPAPDLTKPLTNHFFLLGEYDKKRRLPKAPFLPNYHADKLLYQFKS